MYSTKVVTILDHADRGRTQARWFAIKIHFPQPRSNPRVRSNAYPNNLISWSNPIPHSSPICPGSIDRCVIIPSPSSTIDNHFYYGVRIVTGSEVGSGTPDSDVYFSLVGSKACTGRLPIVSGWFSSAVNAQCYDDMLVESNLDLGEVLIVTIGNPANWMISQGSAWYVEFVDVCDRQTKQSTEFPCYHWINDGDDISFTAKTGKCCYVL